MIDFLKKMNWFISKNKRYYISIIIIGFILALTLLIPADIIGDFTKVISNGNLSGEELKNYLIYNLVLKAFATAVLIYFISTTRRFIQVRLRLKLYYELQIRYASNILKQDAVFFEKYQAGDLLARALGDLKSVNFSGGNRLLIILYETTTVVVYVIAMAIMNPLLTLYSVLPLCLIFGINIKLRVKVKQNWKMVREASSEMSNVILESITNVRTIRAYTKEEENYAKLMDYSNKTFETEKKNLLINAVFQPMFESVIAISVIIAYFYALHLVPGNENFTIDKFVKFMIYLNSLASPFKNIGNMITMFYQSIISIDRLNEIYEAKSVLENKENAKVLDKVDTIEYKNVSFKYPGDSNYTISNINIKLNNGKSLGIVGKTGSGKSTLIRQLLRQFPITEGTILINGIDINDYTKESIRSSVAYVPQESLLFSKSVVENVELGSREDYTEEDVYNAISNADFEKDIENLPNGLNTIVGEYGVTLSGGQKQRLSIARAFMKNADCLILDDSLSAVDGKTESNIINNLSNLDKKKTTIIVAHRLSAVMNCDNIIVLEDGKIIESGNHEELMNNKGWYYTLFNHQLMSKDGD